MSKSPLSIAIDKIDDSFSSIPVTTEFNLDKYPSNYIVNDGSIIYSKKVKGLQITTQVPSLKKNDIVRGTLYLWEDLALNIPDKLIPYLKINVLPDLPDGIQLDSQGPTPQLSKTKWIEIKGDGQTLYTGVYDYVYSGNKNPGMPKSEINTISPQSVSDINAGKVYCKYQAPVWKIAYRPKPGSSTSNDAWLAAHPDINDKKTSTFVGLVQWYPLSVDFNIPRIMYSGAMRDIYSSAGTIGYPPNSTGIFGSNENVYAIIYSGLYNNHMTLHNMTNQGFSATCTKIVAYNEGGQGAEIWTVSRGTFSFYFGPTADPQLFIVLDNNVMEFAKNFEYVEVWQDKSVYWDYLDPDHKYYMRYNVPQDVYDGIYTTIRLTHPYTQITQNNYPDPMPFTEIYIPPDSEGCGSDRTSFQEQPLFIKISGTQLNNDLGDVEVNKYYVNIRQQFKVHGKATEETTAWQYRKGIITSTVLSNQSGTWYYPTNDARVTNNSPQYILPTIELTALVQIACTNPELLRLAREYVSTTR
jgi:hypothetical protein